MNFLKKAVAAAAVLVLAAGISAPTAFAKDVDTARAAATVVPGDNTVTSVKIKDQSIGSGDYGLKSIYGTALRDNTVPWLALGSQLRGEIRASQTKADNAATKAQQALDKPDANSIGAAYYAVAFYDVGDTNAGAIATVACVKETDVAISGGVQTVGLDATANSRNTPVNSSFPGRMDWTTNAPKPNRLDGWVVQFGGNAGTVSDKAPEKVKVYALCVPGLTTGVTQTYLQSADN